MTKEEALKILQTTTDSYNTVAQDFATTRVFAWPEAELFLRYLRAADRPLVVADVGCGNGRMVSWVKKIGAEYIGIDPSKKLLTIARSAFPQDRFSLGDLLHLPLETASVDVCLLNASLHHLPNPLLDQAVSELQRVLKPSGYVFMVNWNLWQPRFAAQHLKQWLKQLSGSSHLGWKDVWIEYASPDKKTRVNRFYHGFTLRELDHLAHVHHFSVLRQYYIYKTEQVHLWNGRNILSVWQKTENPLP